ncbi:MAG: hypothetical protein AB7E04_12375 [Desulfobacteraceae bacterium]
MEKKLNFTAGILFFSAGCAVYAFARENSIFFIQPARFISYIPDMVIFSSPAFFHTFSMILISSPFIRDKKSSLTFLCLSWTVIQIFFETGQKYPDFFSTFFSAPVFSPLNNYFQNGTYDPGDIGMAVAGGLAGFIFLALSPSIFFIFKKGDSLCQKKTKT